jgi:hypothetical protein
MLFQLVGYRDLDFLSGADHIKGTHLFLTHADPASNVVGCTTEKVFVKAAISLPALKPGDNLNIAFTNKGKVESVSVVTSAKA